MTKSKKKTCGKNQVLSLCNLKKLILKRKNCFNTVRNFIKFKKQKRKNSEQCRKLKQENLCPIVKQTDEEETNITKRVSNKSGVTKKRAKRKEKTKHNTEKINILQNKEKTKIIRNKTDIRKEKKKKKIIINKNKDRTYMQYEQKSVRHDDKKGAMTKEIRTKGEILKKRHKIKNDTCQENEPTELEEIYEVECKAKYEAKLEEKCEANFQEKKKEIVKANSLESIHKTEKFVRNSSNTIFRIQYSTNTYENKTVHICADTNNVIEKSSNSECVVELHTNNITDIKVKKERRIRKYKCKNKLGHTNNVSKDIVKLVLSKCVEVKCFIVTYKTNFRNILNNLFNEYMFLKKYLNSNYNTYHKLKFFFMCKHYLKKLHYVLSIFYDVIEQNDEYLLIELYNEIKNNLRLMYYVGRILSNYLTCIAYKKMVYIIIICVARVHTILNCILISEPFKNIVPELLNMVKQIKL
ncbi:hypothetical protein MKS88_000887 [Plasmodium brasilianum]|uniref:Uncharacterized protein n=2 Tax=Plasmodium (Plasmodium) TaxID=418103 RepID=A0A1A8X572_PLAMA|nr:conserved Plasmodium protein, unknown function [Plasmodium malariae]KAI4840654.1 hypothetical protein MKS88_000887 [Plasmodium brasilianum]SBS98909.1 hypothetical protein, conserved [Plasmodium malariae]SBT86218.1 conserved Plasmodium protein, unknown function [Plasmodium malariae]